MTSRFVNATELGTHLRRTLDGDRAALAIRIASGLLYGAAKLEPWPPDPVPEDLWAWHLKITALAYDNPIDADRVTLGRFTIGWSDSALQRLQVMLDQVRIAYGNSTATGPVGSYPAARPWPDPVEVCRTWSE